MWQPMACVKLTDLDSSGPDSNEKPESWPKRFIILRTDRNKRRVRMVLRNARRRSSKKFLGSIGLPPCLLVFVHVGGATTKIYAGWRLGVLFVARLYEWVCVGVGALLCAPARVRLFVCTRFPDVWVCLFMWMGARAGLGQARTCTKGGSIPAGVGAGVGVYWVLSAGHQGARGREGRLRTFAEGVFWRVHA